MVLEAWLCMLHQALTHLQAIMWQAGFTGRACQGDTLSSGMYTRPRRRTGLWYLKMSSVPGDRQPQGSSGTSPAGCVVANKACIAVQGSKHCTFLPVLRTWPSGTSQSTVAASSHPCGTSSETPGRQWGTSQ
jgi:hypothetical protein